MNMKIRTLSLVIVLGMVCLTACAARNPQPVPVAATPGSVKIVNPATAYCEEKGYRSNIVTTTDGSQYGICIFPDGSECEEWSFFRGQCGPTPKIPIVCTGIPQIANPASVNCVEKGGKVDIRSSADGSQFGMCQFPDKSECEEWAFFRGECTPGSNILTTGPITTP